jgi:NAD(P)-dependent dehydrogenase (short-subunit alcohol dehydrogenase family)
MAVSLNGKKALVTGGSKGIGKQIAKALLKSGVHVAIASRSPLEAMAELEVIALDSGSSIKAYAMDLANLAAIADQIHQIIDDFNGIDILINNAGMAYTAEIINTSLEDWQKVLDLNLTSVFECIRVILPTMRSQTSGTIINVASVAAKQAFPTWGAYSASKFAILGLTQSLAAEERSHGIKVMAICPGSVDTPLWSTLDPKIAANFDRSAMLNSETVAELVLTMLTLPSNALISDLVLMPNAGIL